MAYRFKTDLRYSDITPQTVYMNRRSLMAGAGAAAGIGLLGAARAQTPAGTIETVPSPYSTDTAPNSFEEITSYNNYYEFGTGKEDPAENAGSLTVDPWSIEIGGLVDRPGTYGLEDIVKGMTIEERIYRLRCVEGWSMVIPWAGFPLSALLDRVGVQPSAKYLAFETAMRPDEMPGVRRPVLDWPYREGLRLDEARHPLTILATGLYGQALPNQNGAPIRLVVPWKYGFKSIKSIVRMQLVEKQPPTSWNMAAPREYGFYSNVNPDVSHPRWSQATERRIGGGFFARRQETLLFNGYGAEVADLYKGMDLAKYY